MGFLDIVEATEKVAYKEKITIEDLQKWVEECFTND